MAFVAQQIPSTNVIREHYDLLSLLYRGLWGPHIHHGYFEDTQNRREAQEKLLEKLVDFASTEGSHDILDVGCGVGGTAIWLAKNFSAHVTGITLSPVQVRVAKWEASRARVAADVKFEVFDASHLDLRQEDYDAIFCIECSEHLPDKPKFLSDCFALTRPGGKLALCAWCLGKNYSPSEHHELVDEVVRSMLLPSLASAADYASWATDAGYTSVRYEDITTQVECTWDICQRIIQRPSVHSILAFTPQHVRDFASSFSAMKEAFAQGAMSYIILRGTRKP